LLNACVLGGSGFLGSHVAEQLSLKGYHVKIFDSRKSEWLIDSQEMIEGDLLDQDAVSQAVRGADIVYNFAGLADLNDCLDRPIDTISYNVLANGYVLDSCREHAVKRYIYASSLYVLGESGGFYRCSKSAAEGYCREYSVAYGLPVTILRYGSLYGPRSNEKNGLYRIVAQALASKKVRYQGSSEAIREYIHIVDAAIASVHILDDQFANKTVMLTGSERIRISDLLAMLAEILGIDDPPEILESDYPGHYIMTPYSESLDVCMKYSPNFYVDLGQGLVDLIKHVRNQD